jgi:hypothetical protein
MAPHKHFFPLTHSSMVTSIPRRHLQTANSYRAIRTEAFDNWQQETSAQQIA